MVSVECVGGVCGQRVGGLDQVLEGWGVVLYLLYLLRFVCAPSVQFSGTLSMYASYHVFGCGTYRKSRLVCMWLSDLDLSRIFSDSIIITFKIILPGAASKMFSTTHGMI